MRAILHISGSEHLSSPQHFLPVLDVQAFFHLGINLPAAEVIDGGTGHWALAIGLSMASGHISRSTIYRYLKEQPPSCVKRD